MATPYSPSTDLPQVANFLSATGELDYNHPVTTLRLADGRLIQIPTSLLSAQTQPGKVVPSSSMQDEAVAFPIVEEQLEVGKRTIETGKVTLERLVHEYEETLDVPLAVRSFDIERVVLNRPIETAPPVRHEGDTTIYPLVEEQLILTTQLILKEELRVTKRDTERRDTRTVTLKRESIEVTRTPLT